MSLWLMALFSQQQERLILCSCFYALFAFINADALFRMIASNCRCRRRYAFRTFLMCGMNLITMLEVFDEMHTTSDHL